MRSGAEVCKVSLSVKADFLALGNVRHKLGLIGLALFLKVFHRFLAGHKETLYFNVFLDDFLHLSLNFLKVVRRKFGVKVKIVVETVVNGGAYRQLNVRIKPFYCLSHYVRGSMAEGASAVIVLKGENLKRAVFLQRIAQVSVFAVDFSGAGGARQTRAYLLCGFVYGNAFFKFLYRIVFKRCFYHKYHSSEKNKLRPSKKGRSIKNLRGSTRIPL